jgi:hypothetical protein
MAYSLFIVVGVTATYYFIQRFSENVRTFSNYYCSSFILIRVLFVKEPAWNQAGITMQEAFLLWDWGLAHNIAVERVNALFALKGLADYDKR